jgi:threonine aldolase
MAEAEVGDDVFGEDPTVNRLETLAAEMLGFEAAIFASSGTQTNLLAVMSHCGRGDEYIVGQEAHTYKYEGGGAAILGSIQPQPLDFEPNGTLDLSKVARAIKPDDFHYARTKLLCLENTQAGKVLPLSYLEQAAEFTRTQNLSLHLDGARIFNAAIKLNVPVIEIARYFNSVSFCLSKGLGAPVGSILSGSRAFIDRARRWRKVLGGGMRQAGVLAGAGLVVLSDHIERLASDHANARLLAEGLSQIQGVSVDLSIVHTNMVFFSLKRGSPAELAAYLKQRDILIFPRNPTRLVTHLDVGSEDIKRCIAEVDCYCRNHN